MANSGDGNERLENNYSMVLISNFHIIGFYSELVCIAHCAMKDTHQNGRVNDGNRMTISLPLRKLSSPASEIL
jgi:hypothetical protein